MKHLKTRFANIACLLLISLTVTPSFASDDVKDGGDQHNKRPYASVILWKLPSQDILKENILNDSSPFFVNHEKIPMRIGNRTLYNYVLDNMIDSSCKSFQKDPSVLAILSGNFLTETVDRLRPQLRKAILKNAEKIVVEHQKQKPTASAQSAVLNTLNHAIKYPDCGLCKLYLFKLPSKEVMRGNLREEGLSDFAEKTDIHARLANTTVDKGFIELLVEGHVNEYHLRAQEEVENAIKKSVLKPETIVKAILKNAEFVKVDTIPQLKNNTFLKGSSSKAKL